MGVRNCGGKYGWLVNFKYNIRNIACTCYIKNLIQGHKFSVRMTGGEILTLSLIFIVLDMLFPFLCLSFLIWNVSIITSWGSNELSVSELFTQTLRHNLEMTAGFFWVEADKITQCSKLCSKYGFLLWGVLSSSVIQSHSVSLFRRESWDWGIISCPIIFPLVYTFWIFVVIVVPFFKLKLKFSKI